MATQEKTVTKYISDLAAVLRHCDEAFERQLASDYIKDDIEAKSIVAESHRVFIMQITELEQRLADMDASGSWKEIVTSVTGYLAGVYDKLRGETLSRAMRDNFTAMQFVFICQSMLITTAAACDDRTTAQLVTQHQQHLAPLLMRMSECIPTIVLNDLEHDNVIITDRRAPQQAVEAAKDAWRHASEGLRRIA